MEEVGLLVSFYRFFIYCLPNKRSDAMRFSVMFGLESICDYLCGVDFTKNNLLINFRKKTSINGLHQK